MPDNMLQNNLSLSISKDDDCKKLSQICHALSSPERLQILRFLQYKNRSLSDISKELGLPFSSVSRHIDVLSEADLITIQYQPSLKGHAKFCSLKILHFQAFLEDHFLDESNESIVSLEMPIGMFSHCNISSPCGMLGKEGPIGEFDDPGIMFSPDRNKAECLWFSSGYVSYNFPVSHLRRRKSHEISFSFELCSEAPYYNNNWPSDATVSVNGTELFTFTLPGDFGGRKGKYTPDFWPITSTQFGILHNIRINNNGVFLGNDLVNNNVTFDSLNLQNKDYIEFTLSVKEDAVHCGGINLFGANFGDYPQHIIMSIQ